MSSPVNRTRLRRLLAASIAVVALLLAVFLLIFYRGDLPLEELEERYTDNASRFVELDGLRIHYKDEGQGPPLLLLHGTAASLHTWDGWADTLTDRFRLVRLDLPGFGLTGPAADGDHSVERRMAALDLLLDHLQLPQASVAGNSLGGHIAWRYAVARPERVERLLLLDASGYPFKRDPEQGQRSVFDLARQPGGGLLTRFTPRFLVEKGLRQVYVDHSKITPELVDRYYELLLREGNREALLQGLLHRGESHHELIPSIQQRTLVMWGREDRWIPVEHAERFHRELPDSELVIYDGVGHVPMEEIPQRSAEDAAAFLLR